MCTSLIFTDMYSTYAVLYQFQVVLSSTVGPTSFLTMTSSLVYKTSPLVQPSPYNVLHTNNLIGGDPMDRHYQQYKTTHSIRSSMGTHQYLLLTLTISTTSLMEGSPVTLHNTQLMSTCTLDQEVRYTRNIEYIGKSIQCNGLQYHSFMQLLFYIYMFNNAGSLSILGVTSRSNSTHTLTSPLLETLIQANRLIINYQRQDLNVPLDVEYQEVVVTGGNTDIVKEISIPGVKYAIKMWAVNGSQYSQTPVSIPAFLLQIAQGR